MRTIKKGILTINEGPNSAGPRTRILNKKVYEITEGAETFILISDYRIDFYDPATDAMEIGGINTIGSYDIFANCEYKDLVMRFAMYNENATWEWSEPLTEIEM